jgi:hypothetical protein
MNGSSTRSQIHLQMGQEIIYVLMALGLIAALVLIWVMVSTHSLSVSASVPKPESSPPPPTQAQTSISPSLGESPVSEKPPILNLTEKGGFSFDLGSIEIKSSFKDRLEGEVIPEILKLSEAYRAKVIEVIGYTDAIPVQAKRVRSSMDQRLVNFLTNVSDDAPVPTDNVGLGMGRAAAVIRVLRKDPRLQGMTMLPLSAAQTTGPGDEPISNENSPPSPDEERRRIEIRLRRSWQPN